MQSYVSMNEISPSPMTLYMQHDAISSTKQFQLKLDASGNMIRTKDGGLSWIPIPDGKGSWRSAAMSNSGKYMLLAGDQLLVSSNYGEAWKFLEFSFSEVTMSNSGQYQYGVNGSLYRSEDYGVTWKSVAIPFTSGKYAHLCTTQDGRIVLLSVGNTVYSSTDYGKTVVEVTDIKKGKIINITTEPAFMFVTVSPYGIFQSSDGAVSWYKN